MNGLWQPLQPGQVFIEAGMPAEHWVLGLGAAFSSLQYTIDQSLALHLQRHSPALVMQIEKRHFRRLSDGDRWEYLKALSKDVGYAGDQLESATAAFWRCKNVRDLVGHHRGTLVLMRHPETSLHAYISSAVYSDQPSRPIPDPLTPHTFRALAAECRWIEAFTRHLSHLGGMKFISMAFRPAADGTPQEIVLEVLEPPPLPVDPGWTDEGLMREVAR